MLGATVGAEVLGLSSWFMGTSTQRLPLPNLPPLRLLAQVVTGIDKKKPRTGGERGFSEFPAE